MQEAIGRARGGVPSITDAAPSKDDQLRRRRRIYTILMIVHIAGLAVGGALYMQAWLLGLVILILTTPLPWVAVVLANDSPRRRVHRGRESGAERPTAKVSLH